MKKKEETSTPLQANIDDLDVKIIYALLKDARASFSDIAVDCGVSTTTIIKRYRKLKQNEIISGTSIILNLKDLGYRFFVSIAVNINPDKRSEILEILEKLPALINCRTVIGSYDLHVSILTKNFDDVTKIRDLLKRQKGIKTIRMTANTDEDVYFPENLLIEPTETKL